MYLSTTRACLFLNPCKVIGGEQGGLRRLYSFQSKMVQERVSSLTPTHDGILFVVFAPSTVEVQISSST